MPDATDSTLRRWAPHVLSLLRLMSALLLLQHGTQKMLGFPASTRPIPDFLTLYWFAGVIELAGGILLALGLFTRPVAFLLSGFCAVAYFMSHASRSFFPILNGGELAALYSFVFLYFVFAGGGALSLDRSLRRTE